MCYGREVGALRCEYDRMYGVKEHGRLGPGWEGDTVGGWAAVLRVSVLIT